MIFPEDQHGTRPWYQDSYMALLLDCPGEFVFLQPNRKMELRSDGYFYMLPGESHVR